MVLTVNNEFLQCYGKNRLSFRQNQQFQDLISFKTLVILLAGNELQFANLSFQIKNTFDIPG